MTRRAWLDEALACVLMVLIGRADLHRRQAVAWVRARIGGAP